MAEFLLQTCSKIEEDMNVEDEVIEELNRKDQEVAEAKAEATKAKVEAAETKKQLEQEKQSKYVLIKQLHNLGQSLSEIAQILGTSEAQIKQILKL
ncbi:MAG: hypothetical protein AAF806_29355 [Bacteroidota bacterium]